MKYLFGILSIVFGFNTQLTGQNIYNERISLQWYESELANIHSLTPSIKYQTFENAGFNAKTPEISRYIKTIDLNSKGKIDIVIKPLKVENTTLVDPSSLALLTDEYAWVADVVALRNQYKCQFSITPIRKTNGGFERLVEFEYDILFTPLDTHTKRGPENTYTSALSSGTIYKIALPEEGVYKVDAIFLKEKLGVTQSISSDKIQVYSNEGGRLPVANNMPRPDDIQELPIQMNDGGDGKFDNNDYFTFYAQGPDRWYYDYQNQTYKFEKNVYDDKNYAFIKINGNNGKRIVEKTAASSANYLSNTFDFTQVYEEDKTNLLGTYISTEGTGKEWYGDYFGSETSRDYTNKFDLSDFPPFGVASIEMEMAARSASKTKCYLEVDEQEFVDEISQTNVNDIEADYARIGYIKEDIALENGSQIKVKYAKSNSGDEAWLNYIKLIYRKVITNKYDQIKISDRFSLGNTTAGFEVGFTDIKTWDITDMYNASIITPNNGIIAYEVDDKIRYFYLVKNGKYKTPEAIGQVENQNLHSIELADLVIIYHPEFEQAVQKLANHRRSFSNYHVELVNIYQLYNEFSSGRKDPTAIRDFNRMLLERDNNFRYEILFGDGTYDYRNLNPSLPDHNFIPVYETDESLDPINGYPTDDYYALLSEDEGSNLKGALDINLGRITVTTDDNAMQIVNKIINYDTNPKTLGDWRIKIGFTADDEDTNLHVNQADDIAVKTDTKFEVYNQSKIYFDSYVQESTPGGERYPEASNAINNLVQDGALVLSYLGHGGPKGWAQERVLKTSDIDLWTNYNNLPVLITATCSFTGYDDPSIVSAGEYALQKSDGGVLALLTTTRAVYASENKRLTEAVYNTIFNKVDGNAQTLGEIITKAKNENADANNVSNDRKFVLIGDPSQPLALPRYNVNTLTINGNDVNSIIDTISALEKVTITGNITNSSGQVVNDFNGQVIPVIYDKKSKVNTLVNDSGSKEKTFEVYRNILFKGSVTVNNGNFSFTFVMPKDINYNFGEGRISYYAYDAVSRDAAGVFTDVIVGGTDPNAISDNEGPQVQLFMNDDKFVFGGTTNDSPIFLAKLSDDLGINVSGNSIGHDIEAILDGDKKNVIILNDYYEANIDDYSSGTIKYPLKNLSPGLHEITLKAWDVSNNSAEARLEFVVTASEEDVINHVLNYPNPFSTRTTFQFEHDLVGSDLDVYINIYTVSGKLVKTIYQEVFGSSRRVDDIVWDAKDDYGSPLGRGLYIYNIKIKSKGLNLSRESKFEKLIRL